MSYNPLIVQYIGLADKVFLVKLQMRGALRSFSSTGVSYKTHAVSQAWCTGASLIMCDLPTCVRWAVLAFIFDGSRISGLCTIVIIQLMNISIPRSFSERSHLPRILLVQRQILFLKGSYHFGCKTTLSHLESSIRSVCL